MAVERLQAFLGQEAAGQVTPVFEKRDGKAVLVELHTGPDMFATKGLNKLRPLLEGTGHEKEGGVHDFNREQTAAIMANLPVIGRRPG